MAILYHHRTAAERARDKWATLAGLLALCYGVALQGSIATDQGREWYRLLAKPDFTPAGWMIGAVWAVLYGLMAISAWLVIYEREHLIEEKRVAIVAFLIQLGLNALWSWIFFAWRQPVWALGAIIVLHVAVQATGFLFSRIHGLAGWLWLPYVGWTFFATLLNFAIVMMNR